MTLDDITLEIYNEMKAAVRDGDLLSYAGKLARKFAAPIRREDAVETRSNPTTIRPPISQPRSMEEQIGRLNNSSVGISIPAPVREQITREVVDRVRVAQL